MSHFLSYCPTYFDDVVDVNLPVLVVVESVGDALQLVLWNALDLPHDADQLVDADEVLPEGVEQTAYRERFVTRCSWRSGGESLNQHAAFKVPRSHQSNGFSTFKILLISC